MFLGGLGFGMKWMMGWMHDTLEYFKKEPVYRKYHQNDITFSMTYAFSENFMLPLSHDEVVYGKRSLFDRMPGPEWERFANLRLMFGYMFTHPGTKLIFQGGEFAQSAEWNFQESLDWHLLQYDFHTGIQECVKDLNKLYKSQPALYERQFRPEGFEWIEWSDSENSVLSYLRKGYEAENSVLVICNFTPVPRENYKVGVPETLTKAGAKLKELFNSNEKKYGGSGDFISKKVKVEAEAWNGREHSITLDLAPLAVMVFSLK